MPAKATREKLTGAEAWTLEAVNNWGFHVCRNPQLLDKELEYLARAKSGRSGVDRAIRGEL